MQREDYELKIVPKEALFLTAGVDTQPDRLEYEIVAWAKDKQSWSIEYGVIEGDPDVFEDDIENGVYSVWTRLEWVLQTDYKHELGSVMNIAVLAIDTGGGKNTQSVYNWCLTQKSIGYSQSTGANLFGVKNVMPIKGSGRHTDWIPPPNRVPVNGKANALRLWLLGVSEVKKEVYSSLKVERPTDGKKAKPRTCHFPKVYREEYFMQLTSEKLTIVNGRNGVKIAWVKDPSVRNEALDVRVYARAAAHLMGLGDPSKNWKSLENKVHNTHSSSTSKKKSSKAAEILKKHNKQQSFG